MRRSVCVHTALWQELNTCYKDIRLGGAVAYPQAFYVHAAAAGVEGA